MDSFRTSILPLVLEIAGGSDPTPQVVVGRYGNSPGSAGLKVKVTKPNQPTEIRMSARGHVPGHLRYDNWKLMSWWAFTHIPNLNPIHPAVSALKTSSNFFKFNDGACALAEAPRFLLFLRVGLMGIYRRTKFENDRLSRFQAI